MKIKVKKYYVCEDCGRKALAKNTIPAGWMIIVEKNARQLRIVCPDSHLYIGKAMPATSRSNTTYGTYGKYVDYKYTKGEEKKE